jgi:hypothetical protein
MGRKPHPDRDAALGAWEATYGTCAPAYLSVRVMQMAIAYERQCKVGGGLSAQTKSSLRQALKGKEALPQQRNSLTPGAHLVREWNGRSYLVEVTPDGFVLDGKAYRSLSAIARKITGTAWSGPRFFGLTAGKRAAP